jgi:hypothetical protein
LKVTDVWFHKVRFSFDHASRPLLFLDWGEEGRSTVVFLWTSKVFEDVCVLETYLVLALVDVVRAVTSEFDSRRRTNLSPRVATVSLSFIP